MTDLGCPKTAESTDLGARGCHCRTVSERHRGSEHPFQKSGHAGIGPRSSSVAILDFRSRRLADPTISHPDHKAGIVVRAGGEISFKMGQLLPLQFELGLEGEGFANTWLIGG